MRFRSTLLASVAAVASFVLTVPWQDAQAAPVPSLPAGIDLSMPVINYFGAGPQTLAPGITWSSENATTQGGSVFGYNAGYGFASNGFWQGLTMMGTNDSTSSMTVSFATPVSGVGGFINYAPGQGNASLSVFNGANLIETFNLSFLTGGGTNTGQFIGFLESSSIITSFVLTGGFVGLAGLQYQPDNVSQTPLPATLPLFASGLGLLGLLRRRRKRREAEAAA